MADYVSISVDVEEQKDGFYAVLRVGPCFETKEETLQFGYCLQGVLARSAQSAGLQEIKTN